MSAANEALEAAGGTLSLQVVLLSHSLRGGRFCEVGGRKYLALDLESAFGSGRILLDADDCFRLANKLNEYGSGIDGKKAR